MHEKMTRQPSHPGEILHELYMEPLSLSAAKLAEKLGVSRTTISSLINGKTSVTVNMAMRLSQAFGTTPELWLNLQRNLDLWLARQHGGSWKEVKQIAELENGSI